MKEANYLIWIGLATKLASTTLGPWQRFLSTAIAIPQSNTGTPVANKTNINFTSNAVNKCAIIMRAIMHVCICVLHNSYLCTYMMLVTWKEEQKLCCTALVNLLFKRIRVQSQESSCNLMCLFRVWWSYLKPLGAIFFTWIWLRRGEELLMVMKIVCVLPMYMSML